MKVFKDLVAPAVVTDLVSRLISFLITSQYLNRKAPELTERRLQLLTFKIHAVVNEAQQRDLANNQRLLVWVKKLIEGMYLAYYMLDITTHNVDNGGCAQVTSSFFFHMSRAAKRPRLIRGSEFGVDQLSAVLGRLEAAAADLKDFILLLACCPRIPRPPVVSSFRSDDKIKLSRFVEREQIVNFLLQPGSNLGVLPIVGSPEIGKGTMIKHVCSDERIRGQFAVVLYSYGSLLAEENCGEDVLMTLRIGGHVLHESSSSAPGHDRHLVVINNTSEVGVINMEVWGTLCESLRLRAPGSKVIVFGENSNIVGLGTTMAMHVKPLPREEYWYFFKSHAFGGNDPEESPELAVLGMQIAAALKGSFFGAKVLGSILRMNLNTEFWRGVLDVVQMFHETVRGHGDHFSKFAIANIALKTLPLPLRLKGALNKTRTDDPKLQTITVQELLHFAGAPHREEMRIVLWESACPPNNQYAVVCEKVKAEHPYALTERKKRTRQP